MRHRGKAEVWRERILAQRVSGLSIRAWCLANGCHEHSFYMWRRRLLPGGGRSSPPAPPVSPAPRAAFAAAAPHGGPAAHAPADRRIVTSAPAHRRDGACVSNGPLTFAEVIADRPAEMIRLRLSGGRELLLPLSMPAGQVAQLIHAIENQASAIEEAS